MRIPRMTCSSAERPSARPSLPGRERAVPSRRYCEDMKNGRGSTNLWGGPQNVNAAVCRIALPPQPRAQGARLGPTHGHLATSVVTHQQLVASSKPGNDLAHMPQVHEARLVDAEERFRIEALLEL